MKHEPLTNDKGELLEVSVMDNLPTKVKIIDVTYDIVYYDKPGDVDLLGRESKWGCIDFWTKTIRVYRTEKFSDMEVRNTILHEIIHGLCYKLQIDQIEKHADYEKIVHLLATGLNAVLNDNPNLFFEVKE